MKVSIMIPTYNEKENLPKLVVAIHDVCKKNKIKPELVIVDDNSPDGTGEIAEELKKEFSKKIKIHVIHRNERGRGTAGIVGLKYASALKNKYIIEMDADFSHDPKDIPRLIDAMKRCDVAVGSRYVGFGDIERRSIFRNLLSDFANLYIRFVLCVGIKDMSSGFKCYKGKVLESIDWKKIKSKGYSIGAETLYRIKNNGFSISEVPIIFRNRVAGKSKASIKEIFTYLYKILLIRFSK